MSPYGGRAGVRFLLGLIGRGDWVRRISQDQHRHAEGHHDEPDDHPTRGNGSIRLRRGTTHV
jgi:hypothetical protein